MPVISSTTARPRRRTCEAMRLRHSVLVLLAAIAAVTAVGAQSPSSAAALGPHHLTHGANRHDHGRADRRAGAIRTIGRSGTGAVFCGSAAARRGPPAALCGRVGRRESLRATRDLRGSRRCARHTRARPTPWCSSHSRSPSRPTSRVSCSRPRSRTRRAGSSKTSRLAHSPCSRTTSGSRWTSSPTKPSGRHSPCWWTAARACRAAWTSCSAPPAPSPGTCRRAIAC